MRISARVSYACYALLELSMHWPEDNPVQIHLIAEKQGIPMKYLIQILIQLKQLGLVKSIRGKKGGYLLAKAPNTINLGDVIREVSGPMLQVNAGTNGNGSSMLFKDIWQNVEKAAVDVVDDISFERISHRANAMRTTGSYAI